VAAHESALIDTLKALQKATAAALAVAGCRSETGRDGLTQVADGALAEVGRRIEALAEAAAAQPTLFGRKVGDGLDAERGQARVAIGLLRKILTDHVTLDEPRTGAATVARFVGSRVVSGEELALVDALTSGPSGGPVEASDAELMDELVRRRWVTPLEA
jgi:hypothetical protein